MNRCMFFLIIMGCNLYGALPFNQEIIRKIGEQIWLNEGAGKRDNLIVWNLGEDFPSLGIGHFIWHSAHRSSNFNATFDELISFLQKKDVSIPQWVIQAQKDGGAPWKSREDFLKVKKSEPVEQLRILLDATKDLQAQCIIERLDKVLPSIINTASRSKKTHIRKMIALLKESPQGMYALVDYLNFKGQGTDAQERYNGRGWGLLQVLEAMPSYITQSNAVEAFAHAAQIVLEQRIKNAPVECNESRWLVGWNNRLKTYTRFVLSA